MSEYIYDRLYSQMKFPTIIQDLLDFYCVDKENVTLLIKRPPSIEPQEVRDYVKAEIKYAINCGKRIVPVMLDNAPFGDGIRMDLTNTDQLDYNKPDEFSKKLQTSIGFILRNYS